MNGALVFPAEMKAENPYPASNLAWPTSPSFWRLMDKWQVGDEAAAKIIRTPWALSLKGRRKAFKFTQVEADRFKKLNEIDVRLDEINIVASEWMHRKLRTGPFKGKTPAEYLSESDDALHEVHRFLLTWGSANQRTRLLKGKSD